GLEDHGAGARRRCPPLAMARTAVGAVGWAVWRGGDSGVVAVPAVEPRSAAADRYRPRLAPQLPGRQHGCLVLLLADVRTATGGGAGGHLAGVAPSQAAAAALASGRGDPVYPRAG